MRKECWKLFSCSELRWKHFLALSCCANSVSVVFSLARLGKEKERTVRTQGSFFLDSQPISSRLSYVECATINRLEGVVVARERIFVESSQILCRILHLDSNKKVKSRSCVPHLELGLVHRNVPNVRYIRTIRNTFQVTSTSSSTGCPCTGSELTHRKSTINNHMTMTSTQYRRRASMRHYFLKRQ